MASATATGFEVCGICRSEIDPTDRSVRRRDVTPEAHHALQTLSHAIEYLTDDVLHEGKTIGARNPQAQAIQILMTLNRQVYNECPTVPSFSERLRNFLLRVGGVIRNL